MNFCSVFFWRCFSACSLVVFYYPTGFIGACCCYGGNVASGGCRPDKASDDRPLGCPLKSLLASISSPCPTFPPFAGDTRLAVKVLFRSCARAPTTSWSYLQEVAMADVRKELSFCRKTGLNVLGVVENMSGLTVRAVITLSGMIHFAHRNGCDTSLEEWCCP